MSFASLSFALFLPIVVAAYYICPRKYRWAFLLVASCYFYMAFVPWYILILFLIIAIDFIAAQKIESSTGHARRAYLVIGVTATLGVLFVFKYFNFFNANLETLAHWLHWNYSMGMLQLLLPIGLSFHTFQSLSYLVEVYRGAYPAERHIGIYALYVLFFPQLVAGPIERPAHLLPQLKELPVFKWGVIASGLRLVLWGFFKKLVIADRLGLCVDYVWNNTAHVSGPSIVVAAVFFAFQLYADFSGYSDIARGSARMLGVDVVFNFDRPYISRSIAEFWRRWHISLSNWFRDYFYFPLARSWARAGRGGLYLSLLVTFVLVGLWHGAGWTFIILGLLHGSYMVLGLMTRAVRARATAAIGLSRMPRLHSLWQGLFTFALVAFSWVFFRAPDLSTALAFIRGAFSGWSLPLSESFYQYFWYPYAALGFGRSDLIIALVGIAALFGVEYAESRSEIIEYLRARVWARSFVYTLLCAGLVIFGVFTTRQFIYFQF